MLRNELNLAVTNVIKALEEARFDKVFRAMLRPPAQESRFNPLDSYVSFIRSHQQFGKAELQIIQDLNLAFLLDTGFWKNISTREDISRPQISKAANSVNFAINNLPKVLNLLIRESDEDFMSEGRETISQEPLERLSTIVIEEQQKSTPERLIMVFQSIDNLYKACAQILDLPDTDLSVISCDSGSDKAFDFLGLAKIVECIKEVILSFWDRVVYFREDKTERRLELIANSLPILNQIEEMKDSKKMEPERAELLKRQVVDSITCFAKAGVTIPEIEKNTSFDPRSLMKPETKLLVASTEVEEKPFEPDQDGKGPSLFQTDDPEFKEYMEKMAAQYQKQESNIQDEEKKTDTESPEADSELLNINDEE